MQRLSALICLMILFFPACAQGTVQINGDRGGRIGDYVEKYKGLRFSDENVVIDGPCLSACTIVLGAVAQNKICITPRAILGFHAAWNQGYARTGGQPIMVTDPEATKLLYAIYPAPIKRWISARGGLTPRMIFLRGKELQAFYKLCTPNISAH